MNSRLAARMLPAALILLTIVGGLWSAQRAARSRQTSPTSLAGTYSTRGKIEQLPGSSRAAMLQIHHEPIPDFKDRDGKVVGMNSMVMPFAPGDGISLDGLAVGDEVVFTFEHRWGEQPRITSLQKVEAGGK